MRLSKRLSTVASCVLPGAIIADIGTDHAYLPVYLVQKNICRRAVASDLNAGPVRSARETVHFYGLEDRVEVRQGDGLQILVPGEVDTVVVAGMGGLLITRILGEGLVVLGQVQRLILQPNNNARQVRRWLLENDWGLVDEHLIEENYKFYPVIVAEPKRGAFARDLLALEFGPRLLEKGGPVMHRYLEKKRREYLKILAGLSNVKEPGLLERKNMIHHLLRGVEEDIKYDCTGQNDNRINR